MKLFAWAVLILCLNTTVAVAAEDNKITKESEILLVFWTANDCTYCARWKGSLGGKGDLQRWPNFSKITYREVERPFLKSSLSSDYFPADLKWLFERMTEAGRLRVFAPSWWIYVDKKIVKYANGYDNWDKEIFPVLKELVAQKSLVIGQSSATKLGVNAVQ